MGIVFDQSLNTTDSPTFVGITTTGAQSSLGNFVFNTDQSVGAGQDNYILTYDNGTGEIGLEAAPASGATQLSELSDVNTSTPTNRNVLVADGVDFESRALVEADISDLQAYLTTVQLTDLTDVNTSTPTNRNVLVADGVDWESRPLVEADISDLQSYLTTVQLTDLTDVNTSTPTNRNVLVADGVDFESRALVEADISDLQAYLTTVQLTDLTDVNTSTPTNRNVLVADGVDFESRALVEADISDLQSYLTTVQLTDLTDVNTSTPTNRNVLVADGVDWESRALVEADISDLQSYLTTVQLTDLTDVNTSTPTNRNVLVADGVDWESRPLVEADISDLQTYLTTVQLTDLTDVNTSTPTNRNVLVADGVDWESRALVEADISDLGTYLSNVVEDTTPQLGGDLDFNGNGMGHATGASMFYDAVDILSLRRSTNAQSHRIYNTYGDASNNEYLSLDWSTTANTATISTVANGTGTNRDLHIAPATGSTQITGTLDVATGTMTTTNPGIDLVMTWNSGGTQFKGLDVDITNTASAGGSKPISVTVDSTVEYEMRVGGDHYYNGNTLRQLQNLIADTATNMRLRADAGNAVELQSSTNTIAQANQNGFHFKRTVELQIPGTGSTGDGQAQYLIPEMWNGYNLVGVYAYNGTQSTSGVVTFQIRKVTSGGGGMGGGGMGGGGMGGGGGGGVDMLSTLLTIDANESDSSTAATAAVIDTANDDVASHDIIKIDIDSVGTGSGDYIIHLDFELP